MLNFRKMIKKYFNFRNKFYSLPITSVITKGEILNLIICHSEDVIIVPWRICAILIFRILTEKTVRGIKGVNQWEPWICLVFLRKAVLAFGHNSHNSSSRSAHVSVSKTERLSCTDLDANKLAHLLLQVQFQEEMLNVVFAAASLPVIWKEKYLRACTHIRMPTNQTDFAKRRREQV